QSGLLARLPLQFRRMRLRVLSVSVISGFLGQKRFATQFDVSLLDLCRQRVADVASDAWLALQGGLDRLHGGFDRLRALVKMFLHLLAQLHEKGLLVGENFTRAHRAMAGTDDFGAQFPDRFKRLDPFPDVAVAGEVVRPVDARVAGEENLFLRQPREPVSMS